MTLLSAKAGAGTRNRAGDFGVRNRCVVDYAIPAWSGERDSNPCDQSGALTYLPLYDLRINIGSVAGIRTPIDGSKDHRPAYWTTTDQPANNEYGRSGRSRTFIVLVNSEAHCLYATDRKKASDLRPEALLQNALKKVRLHGATLTRFDREGFDEIANCGQMLHIEVR